MTQSRTCTHDDAGAIDCEPPNNRLHKFVGVLKMNSEEGEGEGEELQSENTTDQQHALDNDKILLRVYKPHLCHV